jgi:hypothetical protein
MGDAQKYKNEGWVSWPDFLGFDEGLLPRGTRFLKFEEARDLVWAVGLTSKEEWWKWCDICSPIFTNRIDLPSRVCSRVRGCVNTGGSQEQEGVRSAVDGAKRSGGDIRGRGLAVVGRLGGH